MSEAAKTEKVPSCYWSHDWTRWEQYTINWNATGTDSIKAIERRQKRSCKDCGYTQDNLVSFS